MRKRLARRHLGPHLPFASTVPADNPVAISGSQSPNPLPTSSSGLRGTRPVPVEKSLPVTGTSGNPSANARFAICDASDLSACAGGGGWPGPLPQPSGASWAAGIWALPGEEGTAPLTAAVRDSTCFGGATTPHSLHIQEVQEMTEGHFLGLIFNLTPRGEMASRPPVGPCSGQILPGGLRPRWGQPRSIHR